MEELAIVLIIIGIAVGIFSAWGFLIIRGHINKHNKLFKVSRELSSDKFYDLKARQDYIIASSAIIFAVISLVGFSSIKEIKTDLASQFNEEKKKLDSLYSDQKEKLDSLYRYANSTNLSFLNLKIEGNDLKDSMRSSLTLVNSLKSRLYEISRKEIIRQNLFIVDDIFIKSFPIVTFKQEEYHYIAYDKLKTITGQTLPSFVKPPSVIVFPSAGGRVLVDDITNKGFKVFAEQLTFIVGEDSRVAAGIDDNLKLTIWITQKEPF